MPYLLPGDLDTHIYTEIKDVITREDTELVMLAIKAGIDEAKSYLSRFNLVKLFGSYDVQGEEDVEPTIDDSNLNSKVKDLIVWQLIRLANPNIDLKLARTNYEDAIAWFNMVKKSELGPDGWPYKDDDEDTGMPEGNVMHYISNTLRKNSF